MNFIKKISKNLFIKETKTEIQNESEPLVATSVFKAVTYKCVFKGISFIYLRAPAHFICIIMFK